MRFLRGAPSRRGQSEPPRSRRLQLAHMVDHIEYSVTGSEFESSLCLYQASLRAFGERAQKRLRLRPPAFLRMSIDNPYPRVYVTAKISKTAANALFGPFPSRAAAERYADEMLNLFLLRRCTEDLNPDPAFPGCVYSEMKMCLAPCYKGCSDERYKQESADVFAFLSTRGASMLAGWKASATPRQRRWNSNALRPSTSGCRRFRPWPIWPARQFARWHNCPASWCSRRRNRAMLRCSPCAAGCGAGRALFHPRHAAGE